MLPFANLARSVIWVPALLVFSLSCSSKSSRHDTPAGSGGSAGTTSESVGGAPPASSGGTAGVDSGAGRSTVGGNGGLAAGGGTAGNGSNTTAGDGGSDNLAGAAGSGEPTAAGGTAGGVASGGAAGEPAAGAAGAGGFHASFEDGRLEPWAPGPEGESTVTDDVAADGTSFSLMVPGDVNYYAGPNISFEPIAATSVNYWLRYTGAEPGNNGVAHFALSADLDATDKLLQIWAAREGFIIEGALLDSTVIVGGPRPEPDTWYQLELDIDWTTRAVTLSVDGEPALENELEGTGSAIRRIDLFTVEPATAYFDEITIVP